MIFLGLVNDPFVPEKTDFVTNYLGFVNVSEFPRTQVVRDVNISDKPVYPYRGILLDTARNYYNADAIKSTIGKYLAFFILQLPK